MMSEKRFYLENDEWVKYEYSEIREYVDEKHISIPLRNDELCKLLNELYEENQRLRNDCSILVQSNQEYRKENEQLRRLFEEKEQPITINFTEEDAKELRKLLGLVDDE